MKKPYLSLLITLMMGCSVMYCLADTADAEPHLNIDRSQITVSGISAGAQMAHQLHIAYPDVFSGAAMIAGGPFGCAEGSLSIAMARCMASVKGDLPVTQFAKEIRLAAQDGRVGKTEALSDDQVWVFHATLDNTVARELSNAMVALYEEFLPPESIRFVNDIEAGHNFPTSDYGNACDSTKPPFIGNCDYDAAGELLKFLYDGLTAPVGKPEMKLMETKLPGAAEVGLTELAYLYVPQVCDNAAQYCRTHIVLHGCAQSATHIGTTFIEHSGFIPWAEANNIVLAFPQVAPAVTNPYACWDWWGYTGEAYRWRDGAQMKAIVNWIDSWSDS